VAGVYRLSIPIDMKGSNITVKGTLGPSSLRSLQTGIMGALAATKTIEVKAQGLYPKYTYLFAPIIISAVYGAMIIALIVTCGVLCCQ
jgi:hypothetical protein